MATGLGVTISATIQGLITSLNEATSQVKAHAAAIQGIFNSVGSAVGMVAKPLAALAAVVEGGRMFKDAVTQAADWGRESLRLGRALGQTTEQTSVLKVALNGLGISTDTYTSAANFMARQIARGGDGFQKLGIDIRTAGGHLRPIGDLMQASIERLNGLKAGVDRNTAGIALFGRGWNEVSPLLLLSKERMAQAREEAEKLHLVVGIDGARQAFNYKESLRHLELATQSLKIQVGTALLPVLTKLADWMAEGGSKKASLLADAIKVLISVFLVLKAVVETIVTAMMGQFDILLTGIGGAARVVLLVIQGEYRQAWEETKRTTDKIGAAWNVTTTGIARSWKDALGGAGELWNPPKTKPTIEEQPGGGTQEWNPEPSENVTRAWREQLGTLKALRENWFTWDASRELAFWMEKLGTVKKGTKEYEFALAESNKARKQTLEEGRRLQEQQIRAEETHALESVDVEARAIQAAAQMKLISGTEERAQLTMLEEQKLAIRKRALEKQLELEGVTELQRAQLREQQYQAEVEFNRRLRELAVAATAEQIAEIHAFVDPLVNAFVDGVRDMLRGVRSLGDGIARMFAAMGEAIVSTLAQMAAKWLATKLVELILGRTTAISEVAQQAAVAGAGAAASQAAIPVIGPALAAAAMAETSALVMGTMMPLAMAARGFDVPTGETPLTMLHPREMVLPADIAEGLRSMIVGGQGGGVHLSISAIDGESVERVFTKNQGALLRALERATRDGRSS